MIAGSRGQQVLNPVWAQLTSHRKTVDTLVTALALPIEGEAVGQRRSAAARSAADARWRRQKPRGRTAAVTRMQQGGA